MVLLDLMIERKFRLAFIETIKNHQFNYLEMLFRIPVYDLAYRILKSLLYLDLLQNRLNFSLQMVRRLIQADRHPSRHKIQM